MEKNRIRVLEEERDRLLTQWMKNKENRIKLLVRIMELEEQIEALKNSA
ncbi:hypothetical protein [Thermosediminibacter oceani]|uniref:SMC domain-containing protein n=1 Tax=Thermosediminibacter oceani (strain ATCC BAA-1034 / DSM 16646 / JW/IW-1228P) TaxID=555079 RepID=D9S071_THEOJ|nr:hypothetical protein [Thermosediminibacter oceani]ADL06999.1 SMC domain-containing protein [Thermosediminibacter oceani DSM 16646]